ncbi:hypothetical protein DL96DRAFT_1823413 [Flagelloscypha sp. PMI_526]|nr:hypothetical protein DL96DRAFT_1823413 [Flagelloscypha sp. PMI_526]
MSLGPSYLRLAARNTNNLHQPLDPLLSTVRDTHVRQVDTSLALPTDNDAGSTNPFDSLVDLNGIPAVSITEGAFSNFDPEEYYKTFEKRIIQILNKGVLRRDLRNRNDRDDKEDSLNSDSDLSLRNLLRALSLAPVGDID